MEPPRVGERGVDWRIYIYIYIYPLIYTPLLKDTWVYYVGVEHKVEGKANGNLYSLRKSPSVRMSIKLQCTVTVWQCWRNEASLPNGP